jgi:hypothetical protein
MWDFNRLFNKIKNNPMNNIKNIMNNMKNIMIVALCTLCIVSCGDDFLEEKLTTRLSTQYFDTPEGLKEVAIGLPQVLRLKYSHEFSYAHTQYGTDEFALGSDASNAPWNNYSAGLQSNASGGTTNLVQPITAWDICYVAINTQNTVIDKTPTVLAGDPEQNSILGSAYFFRGWTYFFLVQQWGRVPLK